MSILTTIVKIIRSLKLIEIKNEIKKPTISPTINFKSPSTTNFNFNTIEINKKELNIIADKVTKEVVNGIKTQVVGTIAFDKKLQSELAKLEPVQLSGYLKTSIAGTATISQMQPDFLNEGPFLPKPEEIFRMGYEIGSGGKQINNVKITKTSKNTLSIAYEEED